MSSRGGRDRFRREYPPRSDERSHHGRGNAPPSRHLWVGNLSHSVAERTLTDHFLHFGELESVAFQPGRSYAFINYKNEEDAFAAIRALQGYFVAGNPLKIEFTKAEKSSTTSIGEDYLHRRDERRDEQRPSVRARRSSPDPSYSDKSRISDKSEEPSEVLWIGFPALLKVDETILRKAFSPFGEIVKISAFPGRTYAFVRFKNVLAACRAKETLQGKLFGNPRVHICFARSETGASNSGRNSMNGPPSPDIRSYGRLGPPENFRPDRNYGNLTGDPSMRSPHFVADMDSGDPDVMTFERKGKLWMGGNTAFEQGRFHDLDSELGVTGNVYEHRRSPPRDGGVRFRDFSPQQFPRQGPLYDDAWDLPEDPLLLHGAKKLKTSSFPPENELPEYPFGDFEQVKHVLPRITDFSQHDTLDKNFDSGTFGYKQIPDRLMNVPQPYGERSDHWNAPYDDFPIGSVPQPLNPIEWNRSTPELHQSSPNGVWKWEGTIAKGGTPVCRARCFPVGKVLDMILPEFLDCTARTGLDMLAKHYYQAAGAWVVFFVPESDADIGFYNEFMNYLGEKQRAAVAKLDETTTLFLVPPSEFSEKVLKVPGKLSISGVILRLEQPGSSTGSLHNPHEKKDTSFATFHGDTSYPKPTSPSGQYSSVPSFSNFGNPGVNNASFPGKLPAAPPPLSFQSPARSVRTMSDAINDNRHEQMLHKRNHSLGPNWSSNHPQNSNSGPRNVASQASSNAADSFTQGYNPARPRDLQQTSSTNYATGNSGIRFTASGKLPVQDTKLTASPMPSASLQSEQLAQLASSLLGQQRQSGVTSMGQDFRQSSTTNHPENSYRPAQRFSDFSTSQMGQVQQVQQFQQQQQASNAPAMPQRELSTVAQGNQQQQNAGTQDDGDADPQKRLQATLQLAAALLQQIQQGKGT